MSLPVDDGSDSPSVVRDAAGLPVAMRYRLIMALGCSLLLGACATGPHVDPLAPIDASPWALASRDSGASGTNSTGPTPIAIVANAGNGASQTRPFPAGLRPVWHHYKLPGKHGNQFTPVFKDGRDAVLAQSDASASMLRQTLYIPSVELDSVKFSWKVPHLIAQADMALRHADDSPVRIVLAFEGDRSRFSDKNAMLSELSHTLTGEPLPYATLMYVWCNSRPSGSVIVNPRTDRIRKIVVESGAKNLNQWLDYDRNIRADFEKAFGEPPGALVGIGIMTDTDNTHSMAKAWYGKVNVGAKDKGVQNALGDMR